MDNQYEYYEIKCTMSVMRSFSILMQPSFTALETEIDCYHRKIHIPLNQEFSIEVNAGS